MVFCFVTAISRFLEQEEWSFYFAALSSDRRNGTLHRLTCWLVSLRPSLPCFRHHHRGMNLRSIGLFTGLAIFMAAGSANRAMACACCSDPGTRFEAVVDVSDFHRDQLRGLEFAKDAELFMTEAGEDSVKGITTIAEKYQLAVKMEEKQWRLTFQTEDGKSGTLTLPFPVKLGSFQVDPREGRKSAGGGPLLYKEWRWEGTPSTTGIFQKGATRFSLVLQGHGNRCDGGDDFSHWRLEVTGKGVSYALYGALVRPGVDEAK
jgi:hypothetical protein